MGTSRRYAKAIPRRGAAVLIDLGANVGLSAIALARELEPLAIVAVQPDRGNFEMLQENLRRAKAVDAVHSIIGLERSEPKTAVQSQRAAGS